MAGVLLTALQKFQKAERDALLGNEQTREQGVERLQRLCAAVNSSSNGDRETEQLMENLREMLPTTFHGGIEPSFEQAQTDFLALGREVSEAIADFVVTDAGFKQALGKLFVDESWHTGTLVQSLAATIEDYFNDISTWIEESFFKRVAESVLQYTVRAYVAAFLERRVSLSDTVLQQMTRDEHTFIDSFSKYIRNHRVHKYADLLSRMIDLAKAGDDDNFVSALCAASRTDSSITLDAAERVIAMRDDISTHYQFVIFLKRSALPFRFNWHVMEVANVYYVITSRRQARQAKPLTTVQGSHGMSAPGIATTCCSLPPNHIMAMQSMSIQHVPKKKKS